MLKEVSRISALRMPSRARVFLFASLKAAVSALLTLCSYLAALGLRFDFDPAEMFPLHRFLLPAALLCFLRITAYHIYGCLKQHWHHVSLPELVDLIKAHLLSGLTFAAAILLFRVPEFPRAVIFTELAFSILLAAGVRLTLRIIKERGLRRGSPAGEHNAIILGAGDAAHLLVKNLLSNRGAGYRPAAVLDDSEHSYISSVHGVKIWGRLLQLDQALSDFAPVSLVILAMPSFSPERAAELEGVCRMRGVPFRRLSSLEDIAFLDLYGSSGPAAIEGLLDRTPVVEHEKEISQNLGGKIVLVTGAGGSIGSEIVRQIVSFRPRKIVVFDNNEFNLFRLQNELRSVDQAVQREYVMGSICDRARLDAVFRQSKPQIVFHAAAYKHVPLMEHNAYEAFCNNVLGSRNVMAAALEYQARRFVLISSDKAVAPCNIMGLSKRIAEMLVLDMIRQVETRPGQAKRAGEFSAAAVRFGNVINSSGSVIPTFMEQIRGGGPLTITHPEMERYFMSLKEAVRLVLTAGILGGRGEVYVLEMGKRVKILDLAKKMLALCGRDDIPVVFTGLRPGERLSEQMTSGDEKVSRTEFSKVMAVESRQAFGRLKAVHLAVSGIEARLSSMSDAEIADAMYGLVYGEQKAEEKENNIKYLAGDV